MIDDFDGIFKSSRLEQIYIMDLFALNPSPFTGDPNQMNVQSRLRGNTLQHYTWDFRTLADSLSTREISGGYKYIDSKSLLWKPIFVSEITHEQDSKHLSTIDTFNPVSSFAHLTSSKLQTGMRFRSFLITTDFKTDQTNNKSDFNDPILKSQNILYKSFIIPALPLLFTSSSDNSNFVGPQFPLTLSISVSDTIGVALDFTSKGGRILKSKGKAKTEFTKNYRVLRHYDCAIDWQAHESVANFFAIIDRKTPSSIIKIVSMNLEVEHNYDVKSTGLGPYDLNKLGPRFITLTSRTVKGNVKFIASSSEYPTNLKNPLGYNGLTMYFGGCLLFILPNILWQKPKITMTSESLYLHDYDFIALATDGAKTNAFKAYNKGIHDISEFKLPIDNPNLDLQIMNQIRNQVQEDARK
jgi:hypothetical protein